MDIERIKGYVGARSGLARGNLYYVKLPFLPGVIYEDELDVLCTNVNMPGRQILTTERLIGVKGYKMPTGFASDDISMSFLLTNTYSIKDYFEQWQNLVVNQDTFEIGYADSYGYDVTVRQLSRSAGSRSRQSGFRIGGPRAGAITSRDIVHAVKLKKAFPTTMSAVELSNDNEGLMQLTVQLSYRNWESVPF